MPDPNQHVRLGSAILGAMKANPKATRKGIAERAGCTVGRIGEVVRYLAAPTPPQRRSRRHRS